MRWFGIAAGAIGLAVCGLARDAGRRLQPELWASWGGSPTVRRLRWRDADDPERVRRIHERVQRQLDWTLPDEAEESRDPDAADRCYDDAIEVLRARTRDSSRFKLLFNENAEYGFRRNALGIRPFALLIAFVAFLTGNVVGSLSNGSGHWIRWGIAALVSAICALYWWRVVTPQWVRRSGEVYADRLYEAAETLDARKR